MAFIVYVTIAAYTYTNEYERLSEERNVGVLCHWQTRWNVLMNEKSEAISEYVCLKQLI